MREYEVTIILEPKLEEEPRNAIIERVLGWVVDGEVTDDNRPKVDLWGRRRMAYPIRKNNEGFYVYIEANIDPERLVDIERNFQYNESIMRYLIVRKEDVVEEEAEAEA